MSLKGSLKSVIAKVDTFGAVKVSVLSSVIVGVKRYLRIRIAFIHKVQ